MRVCEKTDRERSCNFLAWCAVPWFQSTSQSNCSFYSISDSRSIQRQFYAEGSCHTAREDLLPGTQRFRI